MMFGWQFLHSSISSKPSGNNIFFDYYSLFHSINAHAEDLRHMFVAHEGKKELIIDAVGSRHSVDFGALAVRMTKLIDKNVCNLSYSSKHFSFMFKLLSL